MRDTYRKSIQWRRCNLFNLQCWEVIYPAWKEEMGRRNKFYVHSTLCSKFKLKLNVKPKIIKFLEYDRKILTINTVKVSYIQ